MKRVDFTEEVVAKWSEKQIDRDLSVLGLTQRILWVGRMFEEVLDRKARTLGFRNRGDYEVAALLRRFEPQSLTAMEVAARLRVSGPGMVSRLQNLEEQGHIVRIPHPTDGRARRLQLTAKGRAATDEAFDTNVALYETLFTDLTTSDKHTLDRILKHVLDSADQHALAPHSRV